MQCVILAAGEGVRMRPLTNDTPKPLLKVLEKPLIEYHFESLPREIHEVIVVVGYLADKISDFLGTEFLGKKIKYVFQSKKEGTFAALKICESYLDEENFLLLYADDLVSPKSLSRCVESHNLCVLLASVDDPKHFGVAVLDPDGTIREIEEKPEKPKNNLVNCGPAVLNKKILDYEPPKHANGEYYITDAINLMIKDGYKFYGVTADWWLPIGYPHDLKKAEKFLKKLYGN